VSMAGKLKSNLQKTRNRLIDEQKKRQASETAKAVAAKATQTAAPAPNQQSEKGASALHSSSDDAATKAASDDKMSVSAQAPGTQTNPFEQFEKKSTVRNLEKALNYLWFELGEIHKAKALIEANPKLVEKLGDVPKSLSARALGEVRIQNIYLVPERSQYPAYIA